jgi:hypothetical protein
MREPGVTVVPHEVIATQHGTVVDLQGAEWSPFWIGRSGLMSPWCGIAVLDSEEAARE